MEINESPFESLIQRFEMYSKTSLELVKLKSISKISNVFSKLFVHIILAIILCFFILFLSLGVATFIGECLEKTYYGYVIIAGFYFLIGIVTYFFRKRLKAKIINSIISHFLN